MPDLQIVNHLATRAMTYFQRQNLLVKDSQGRDYFYAWAREDRLILVLDPELIKNQAKIVANDDFRHDLSTILSGRRVVVTNSRGIFVQIAYNAPPAPNALRSVDLDLSQQPGPYHVPVGMTRSGPLWLSLIEMDSLLIGGARRMGKTRVVHGMILALLRGGQANLYLWDGKGGVEFGRYAGRQGVTVANNLYPTLLEIQRGMVERGHILERSGRTSVAEYNQQNPGTKLPVIVPVIDEISQVSPDCQTLISDLVGRGGAYGIYPIIATTRPGEKEVQGMIRSNLSTRICLPVPTQNESRIVLGQKGAEGMPKIQGRMLMVWDARLVEVQAFRVAPPTPQTIYLGPVLAGPELEIARAACERAGEGLTIDYLKRSHGMSDWKAGQLLKQWESHGWLIKNPDRGNARSVTPALRVIVAQSSKHPERPERPESEEEA